MEFYGIHFESIRNPHLAIAKHAEKTVTYTHEVSFDEIPISPVRVCVCVKFATNGDKANVFIHCRNSKHMFKHIYIYAMHIIVIIITFKCIINFEI